MVQHPDKQRRAQAEIDSVISDRLPKISDRGTLPYVEAIIKEVMRWRPALPLSMSFP
jgi:cytochrome P450